MSVFTKNKTSKNWEKKYQDSVNELHSREREWQKTDNILRKIVSRVADAATGFDEALDKQLSQMRAAVCEQKDVDILRQQLDVAVNTEGENVNTVPAEQALIELLGRIDVPESLQEQAYALRQTIVSELTPNNWLTVVHSMATLISAIQSKSKKDQDNLESFLSAISGKLYEIDVQMQGGANLRKEGADNRQRMDEAVRLEVEEIGTSVCGSSDFSSLKTSVESQIDSVIGHMNRYRNDEDARVEQEQGYLQSMTDRLSSMEDEAQSLREQVILEREQAMTDALTQIPNRLAFETRFDQEIESCKDSGDPLILLVWDVDHFKGVNDTYGHIAGDKVLKKLASVLFKSVRGTDFTARFGGEEFVMLMTGSPMDACFSVADKLRKTISQLSFRFKDQQVDIAVSCGLSQYSEGEDLHTVFERADAALYKAKKQGRDQCVIGD